MRFQAGFGEEHPPRPCLDQTETHPVWASIVPFSIYLLPKGAEADPLFLLALENKLSMFLRLLFVSTPRSTLILLSLRPLEEDVLDVSRERSPRVVTKRMMRRERTRKTSRFHAGNASHI